MSEPVAAAVRDASFAGRFDRPIFIISPPRSGSTLLFETLSKAPGLHTVGGESHGIVEGVPAYRPAARNWHSNRLTAADADPELAEQLARAFYERLRDRDGRAAAGRARMLEKTPKNSLRVPLFDAIWPDAQFVYLYRDPRATLASMIEAWRSGWFRTYQRLPDWPGTPWSLLLVPGWEKLKGEPLERIVAEQWRTTTEILLADLAAIDSERVHPIVYEDFLASPQSRIERLAASLDLGWDVPLGPELPLSRYTMTRPSSDKWKANADALERVWDLVGPTDARARAFVDSFGERST